MIRGFCCLLALALTVGSTGCINLFDPLGREKSLESAQREYTKLVRWGLIERASVYVDPALRQEFLAFIDDFESIRVTDFEIGNIRFEDDGQAVVTVEYHAFATRRAMEVPIKEKQRWYRENVTNTWLVRPELEGFGVLATP